MPAGEYYDYHAKYVAEDTQYICPGLTGAAEARNAGLALAAFRAAGCSGWGRVDVMRDRSGANFLLEVNTAPGMTSHSLVPKAARAIGIEFDDLVWRVLETSLGRKRVMFIDAQTQSPQVQGRCSELVLATVARTDCSRCSPNSLRPCSACRAPSSQRCS